MNLNVHLPRWRRAHTSGADKSGHWNMKTDLLSNFDIGEAGVRSFVSDALHGADDGELYLEYSQ